MKQIQFCIFIGVVVVTGILFGCQQPVLKAEKTVKFSDSFLREFPKMDEGFSKLETSYKFKLLERMTKIANDNFVYQDKVTNQDIAVLIEDILINGMQKLSAEEKGYILAVCAGQRYAYGTYDSETGDFKPKLYGGWYVPIPETKSYLIRFLSDADDDICSKAINVLAKLNAKEAIPQIIKLLDSKDRRISNETIIEALADLDAKEAIPIFREKLRDMHFSTVQTSLNKYPTESAICVTAAKVLARLGDKESIPDILKLTEKGQFEYVRGWAAVTLVELGAKDELPDGIIDDMKGILGRSYFNDKKRIQSALKQLGVEVKENE